MAASIHRNDPTRSPVGYWLLLTVGVGIVLSTGVIYGHYSQRWGPPADLVAAGTHVESMPRRIGKWQLIEELPIGDVTLTMLECSGYVNRRYVHEDSGEAVNIAITVGPAGPTSVHTPEICYSSRAYELQGKRVAETIGSPPDNQHSFWRVDMKPRNVLADTLRVYYAWSRGSHWEAAESPRVQFAASPLLFKIQLAGLLASDSTEQDADPGRQFLDDLIATRWTLRAQ